MRRKLACMLVVGVALTASSARADREDDIRACADASEQGQRARLDGKLVEASDLFVKCARSECPAEVRGDCDRWAKEVGESLPTVILVVHDARGGDVTDVSVTVDGVDLLDPLGGRAVALNPGPHTLRFQSARTDPREERVVVREGEKRRKIEIVLVESKPPGLPAAPPKIQDDRPNAGPPLASLVLLGVGGVALGVASYFAIRQQVDFDDLDKTCAPRCSRADAEAINTKRVVAGVAAGVGVVAVAAGVWLWVARPSKPGAPGVALEPRGDGAALKLGGSW